MTSHGRRTNPLIRSALLIAVGGGVWVVAVRSGVGQHVDNLAYEGRKSVSLSARRALTAVIRLGTPAFLAISAAIVIGLSRRRRRRRLVGASVLASTAIAALAASLLKATLDRSSLLAFSWATPDNTFPSGHTAAAITMMMGLITLVTRSARARVTAALAVFAIVSTLGVLGSGWHRPSDVVGGLLLGAAAASAVIPIDHRSGFIARDPRGGVRPWFVERRSVVTVLAASAVTLCILALALRNVPSYPGHPFLLFLLAIVGASALTILLVTSHASTLHNWEAVDDWGTVGETAVDSTGWSLPRNRGDLSTGTVSEARVAVIGCGYWGRNLVRTLAQTGALAAVVDPDTTTAAALAEQHDAPSRSLEDVLNDSTVDAVVIAAPAKDHAALALAALRAGKHAFVEKPLALDVADAEMVVTEAQDRGLTLMVGHLLQYHPAFLALRQMVTDGALGELRYLYSNRLNLGRIRREENILWSFAPHDLSMLLALVGESPVEVTAVGSTFLSDNVPDVTTTHMSFPSGPRAHVFVSWLHPFKEQRLVVVGADAMAVFDDTAPWESKLVVYEHGVTWDGLTPVPVRGEPVPIPLEQAEPLRLECEHFLDCIATGEAPRTDGEEGVRVLKVLDAAQRSLSAGGSPVSPGTSTDGAADAFVHPSAYIDDDVIIGPGTKVWHFGHVLSGSRIGADCALGQNVVVGPDVSIGDRCRIQNNVSVYNGVTLEDGVFCGPSCVFTNVHNPRAEVSRKDEFRPTLVRQGATIGANATIVCGHEIGEYAFIGAGAVVTSDVPAHGLMVGAPARRVGWMSHEGERLGDDLVCPRSGRRYKEHDGSLVELQPSPTTQA